MRPGDVELHDATVDSAQIDFAKRAVSLFVSYYPDPVESAKRVPARITFAGVETLNGSTDLMELASHRRAGNIVYWNPASGTGTTYIYLTGGLIAVAARSVKFSVDV